MTSSFVINKKEVWFGFLLLAFFLCCYRFFVFLLCFVLLKFLLYGWRHHSSSLTKFRSILFLFSLLCNDFFLFSELISFFVSLFPYLVITLRSLFITLRILLDMKDRVRFSLCSNRKDGKKREKREEKKKKEEWRRK